jgi:hypothetical protein
VRLSDDAGRSRWSTIDEMMGRHEAIADEGTMRATLDRLSDREVESIERQIREFCAMYPFTV